MPEAPLVVEDLGLGVLEVFCGRCRAYCTRLTTDMPQCLAGWKANVPWWPPATFGHTCGTGTPTPAPRQAVDWHLIDPMSQEPVRQRPARAPVPSSPRLTPDVTDRGAIPAPTRRRTPQLSPLAVAEGILWYSAQQRAVWHAQGRAPAYGRLTDGRVVEYTELKSGAHAEAPSAYADAVSLGWGAFDHLGEA